MRSNMSCAAFSSSTIKSEEGTSVVLYDSTSTSGPRALTAQWRQDEFFISFWVGPQASIEELDIRFAEIVEANFTGYLGFDGYGGLRPNPQRVAAEIKLCDKHGLKCVPSLCAPEVSTVPASTPPTQPCRVISGTRNLVHPASRSSSSLKQCSQR
jgi:hypothetical protein